MEIIKVKDLLNIINEEEKENLIQKLKDISKKTRPSGKSKMKSKIIKDDYVEICKVDNKNSTVVIKYYTTKTTIHI
jgi:hypothetical protein